MRKSVRTLLCAGIVTCMVLGSAMTSLAGTWRQGAIPNENQWWYDFDNGTYAKEGWQWIDSNNDGIAECYYFDTDGWMLSNTTTPDGFIVNTDGAWTQNGAVQTKGISVQDGQTQQATANTLWMYDIGADGSMKQKTDLMFSDYDDWTSYWRATNSDLEIDALVAGWAEVSERGAAWKALFDRYAIPYDLTKGLTVNPSSSQKMLTFTTPVGMTEDDKYSAGSAIEMMLWLCSDGMTSATWTSTLNEDGSVTITAEVHMMG